MLTRIDHHYECRLCEVDDLGGRRPIAREQGAEVVARGHGKIVILDLPQKEFNELGVYAQALFKFSWQRSVERRKPVWNTRPVFLWADESQFFCNSYDVLFQTTARSARVATVYLTQNIPNYHLALGGSRRAEPFVESLLGNLNTKIFITTPAPLRTSTRRNCAVRTGETFVQAAST